MDQRLQHCMHPEVSAVLSYMTEDVARGFFFQTVLHTTHNKDKSHATYQIKDQTYADQNGKVEHYVLIKLRDEPQWSKDKKRQWGGGDGWKDYKKNKYGNGWGN